MSITFVAGCEDHAIKRLVVFLRNFLSGPGVLEMKDHTLVAVRGERDRLVQWEDAMLPAGLVRLVNLLAVHVGIQTLEQLEADDRVVGGLVFREALCSGCFGE